LDLPVIGHPDLGSRPDAALAGKALRAQPKLKQPGAPAEEGVVTGFASHPSTRSAGDRPPAAEDAGRCPGCNARVRPEYAWCALCHRDLRPQAAQGPEAPEGPKALEGFVGPEGPEGPGSPAPEQCEAGQAGEDERAAAEAEALVLLHHLRASESAAGMPALLSSLGTGGRAVLALGVGALLVLLLLGGSAVLGLLL
jgi:hypothetical protein